MIRLALVGRNISHSKSPAIYRRLLGDEINYQLLDYSDSSLIPSAEDLLTEFTGVSITTPYKEHFLSEVQLSSELSELAAINCLYRNSQGMICGANTDYMALEELITRDITSRDDWDVVILGSGAMARVCGHILKLKGKSFSQVSRRSHGPLEFFDLGHISSRATCIINCCARDFHFRGGAAAGSHFWDLNYARPSEKVEIERLGLSYQDGEELLFLQAKHALSKWKLA